MSKSYLWRSFGLRPLDDGVVFVIQSEAKNLPAFFFIRHSERSEESPSSLINLTPMSKSYLWRSFGLRPLDDGWYSSFRAKRRISMLFFYSSFRAKRRISMLSFLFVIQSEAKNLPAFFFIRHSERSEESPS